MSQLSKIIFDSYVSDSISDKTSFSSLPIHQVGEIILKNVEISGSTKFDKKLVLFIDSSGSMDYILSNGETRFEVIQKSLLSMLPTFYKYNDIHVILVFFNDNCKVISNKPIEFLEDDEVLPYYISMYQHFETEFEMKYFIENDIEPNSLTNFEYVLQFGLNLIEKYGETIYFLFYSDGEDTSGLFEKNESSFLQSQYLNDFDDFFEKEDLNLIEEIKPEKKEKFKNILNACCLIGDDFKQVHIQNMIYLCKSEEQVFQTYSSERIYQFTMGFCSSFIYSNITIHSVSKNIILFHPLPCEMIPERSIYFFCLKKIDLPTILEIECSLNENKETQMVYLKLEKEFRNDLHYEKYIPKYFEMESKLNDFLKSSETMKKNDKLIILKEMNDEMEKEMKYVKKHLGNLGKMWNSLFFIINEQFKLHSSQNTSISKKSHMGNVKNFVHFSQSCEDYNTALEIGLDKEYVDEQYNDFSNPESCVEPFAKKQKMNSFLDSQFDV